MLSRLTLTQSHSDVVLHAVTKIDGSGPDLVSLTIRLGRIIRRYPDVTEHVVCHLPGMKEQFNRPLILSASHIHDHGVCGTYIYFFIAHDWT